MNQREVSEALHATVMAVLQLRCDAVEAIVAEPPTPENWAVKRAEIMRLFDGIPAEIQAELLAKA